MLKRARKYEQSTASAAAVKRFGLRHEATCYKEIDAFAARRLIQMLLHREMA